MFRETQAGQLVTAIEHFVAANSLDEVAAVVRNDARGQCRAMASL